MELCGLAFPEAPDGTRVVVHQTALGAHETELPLTYQSRMLAGSSLVPERFLPSNIDKIQFLQAMYLDSVTLGALPAFPTRFLCQLLGVPWLRIPIFLALTPLMILHQIQQRLSGNRQLVFRTPVRTLSSILKEQGLLGKTVDLLKVDVEGRVVHQSCFTPGLGMVEASPRDPELPKP